MKSGNEKITSTNRVIRFLECLIGRDKIRSWQKIAWKVAEGRVLELDGGLGGGIPFYRNNLEISVVNPDQDMLMKASQTAEFYHKSAAFRRMDLDRLEFPAGTFDSVVATCVFGAIPNPMPCLLEIKRVLKTTGRLIVLEQVRNENPVLGRMMDWAAPAIKSISGVTINRNIAQNLRHAGFVIMIEQDLAKGFFKHINCRK